MQKKSLARSAAKSAAKPAAKISADRGAKFSATRPPAKMATAKSVPAPQNRATNTTPTREEIARRAYEIYLGRGQTPGRERDDWAQAERELIAEAHRKN